MVKPFELEPFTMFKNVVLDYIMPKLSGSAWKVLCVAIRQTWGWEDKSSSTGRKQSDRISYSQFKAKTGIKSDTTISRSIRECLDAGYLVRFQVGTERGKPAYHYRLNTDYELDATTTPENGVVTTPESVPVTTPENGVTKERERNKTNGGGGGSDDGSGYRSLLDIGVTPGTAKRLAAKSSLDTIEGWIAYARSAKNLRDAPALVVARLRDGEPPPELLHSLPARDDLFTCGNCCQTMYQYFQCPDCRLCRDCCTCTKEVIE